MMKRNSIATASKKEKEKEKGIGERIMGAPSKEINIPD